MLLTQPFQYLLILRPTADEAKQGVQGAIIYGPVTVLARDEATTKILGARAIPPEYADKIDRIEVVVRPFYQGQLPTAGRRQ